jgi:hypothetical protein
VKRIASKVIQLQEKMNPTRNTHGNPIEQLNLAARRIWRRQEGILRDFARVSSPEGRQMVDPLEPVLLFLQAQLESCFPVDEKLPPSGWMELFDAFDDDTEWLEKSARLLDLLDSDLAKRFRELAVLYLDLVPMTFGAWIWAERETGARNSPVSPPRGTEPRLAA